LTIVWLVLYLIGLVASISVLIYYSFLYYQKQLDSTDLGTIVSLLGVILVMINMFWNLLNEPTLEFGDITKNNEPAYFITVNKKGGKGYAKNCEGKIKIENIDTHTVWSRSEYVRTDIGDYEQLRLFATDKNNNIIDFPSAFEMKGRGQDKRPLDEFLDKELTIEVFSETHSPTPLKKTIRKIIASSKNK
jgi:hypothetical protein